MRKYNIHACFLFIMFLLLINIAKAQSFIDFSKYNRGSLADNFWKIKVVNGETDALGSTLSCDFPVTNGSTLTGTYQNLTLTKYIRWQE